MYPKPMMMALALGTFAGFVAFHPTLNAAKPAGLPAPCAMTFYAATTAGAAGKITGDGPTAYVDGVGGVSCTVGASGTGINSEIVKLTLDPKKTLRRFWADWRDPLQVSPIYWAPAPPPGSSTDGQFLSIPQIATMSYPSSSPRITLAHFRLGGSTFFHWCGQADVAPCNTSQNIPPGSMAVSVTRLSKTRWVVTTDTDASGLVGDVAELYDNNTQAAIGLYHMPFQISIDCPGCP